MFTCRVCKNTNFTVLEMRNERRLLQTHRGICKTCSSEYEKLRIARKKAEQDKENHLVCNNCDRVFSKFRRGNPNGNNQYTNENPELYELAYKKYLNTECPFCKSEDIERY